MVGKRLERGQTVGLVAPAGIESADKIMKGIDFLKNLGFKVKEGKHIYDRWGYLAGNDADRAQDIIEMFQDQNVDAVLCVRGGYGAMRLLPYLDFNKIRRNEKIFVGYSDITVLLNSFYQKADLISFHGPMLSSNFDFQHTLNSFISTLMEGQKEFVIKNPEGKEMASNTDRCVEGRLAGGNLSLIVSTMGTPYEINFKNRLLFIEEIGEDPYRIDRMLTQLILSGKLQECSGIILGQFTDCDGDNSMDTFSLKQVLEDRLTSLNKPILANCMSGHDNPKLVIPIGARAVLNGKEKSIEILEKVVK